MEQREVDDKKRKNVEIRKENEKKMGTDGHSWVENMWTEEMEVKKIKSGKAERESL